VRKNLDKYFQNYSGIKASVEERFLTKATLELVSPLSVNKSVLQMGLGNGIIARFLDKVVSNQVVIEGSKRILEEFSFGAKNTKFINSFFEDFTTENKYDLILANHVLEHVINPVDVLNHVKNFLTKEGIIFITVPNANSIHRLIGVEMQIIQSKYELHGSDKKAGHRRVYDYQKLEEDIEKASLNIVDSGGYNLKMVSLAQMKDWPEELLDAIFTVSLSMPKYVPTFGLFVQITIKL